MLTLITVISCEKNVIGDFEGQAAEAVIPEQENIELTEEQRLSKRGVAFTNNAKAWSYRTSDLAVHWMYSWGNALREEIPENVEYVPMFWGKGSVNEENLTRIKGQIDEGKVTYVLGFNEPDGASQANMTVDEAIALWPQLETLGVPLGSPATVSPNNEWMIDFMEKAEALNLRIDFVTVHSYGGPNVLSFINKLKETYQAYERPIWVTEFAVADWNATSPENNRHSEAAVIEFMEDALVAMNDIDWVHRYAWFDGGTRPPLASSALFDEDANLTALGQVYAGIKPNTAIGPGQETEYTPAIDLDELLLNGGFEDGKVPWGGFKSGAVGIATTEPVTGNFSGRIENGDGSLLQAVAIEEGSTYILKFSSKWRDAGATNALTPIIRDDAVGGADGVLFRLDGLSTTDEWEETSYEFTVLAGVSTLRIVFYKANGNPPLFLDDVSLKLK